MMTNTRIICCGIAICAAVSLGACGSSSSSATPGTTGDATDTTSVSNAVPGDVVLASPTASTSASASISVGKSTHKTLAGDATTESYDDKKAATEALRTGTGECGFTPPMDAPPTMPECYGPKVAYTGHADGSPSNGDLPNGDVGIWDAYEGTEACAAAQMNYLISAVSKRVDTMINMFNNMACVGKKEGILLPAIGATVDIKSALETKSTMTGITVNTATIERLADDADGNPVYKSIASVTIGTHTGTATLKHIKTGTDAYKGKLSMTISNATAMSPMNCTGAAAGSVHAAVISYAKTSATSVVYEMNFAEFCGADATPLDSNNNIARTDAFNPTTNLTGWGSDWNYALFNLNPSNGTGTVAYAWQAGFGDERTRVLDATVTAAADGSASGTAYYGFGPDVNGTATLGTIEGFICNWAGPDGATQSNPRTSSALITAGKEWPIAQKQTLTRAAGGTEYTPASSSIKYAPEKSCDKFGATPDFHFQAVRDGTFLNLDNDITDSTLVTNDLIDIGEITTNFTLPTPPTDVGG